MEAEDINNLLEAVHHELKQPRAPDAGFCRCGTRHDLLQIVEVVLQVAKKDQDDASLRDVRDEHMIAALRTRLAYVLEHFVPEDKWDETLNAAVTEKVDNHG